MKTKLLKNEEDILFYAWTLTLYKYFISVFIFLLDTISDWNSFKLVKHLFLSVIVRWPTLISSPTTLCWVNKEANLSDKFSQPIRTIMFFPYILKMNVMSITIASQAHQPNHFCKVNNKKSGTKSKIWPKLTLF